LFRVGAEQLIIRFAETPANFPAHIHLNQRELLQIQRGLSLTSQCGARVSLALSSGCLKGVAKSKAEEA
jgi:hypothetical protein